jgi:hypothetical protein
MLPTLPSPLYTVAADGTPPWRRPRDVLVIEDDAWPVRVTRATVVHSPTRPVSIWTPVAKYRTTS